METRYEILELARFLTELSVIDYYFVVHKASDVALAALLNSMEAVTGSIEMTATGFGYELSRIVGGLNPYKKEVLECRDRLQVLYTQGGYSRPEITGRETRDETVSPVCVSFGLAQQQQAYPSPSGPVNVPQVQANDMEHEENEEYYEAGVLSVKGIHDLSKSTSPVPKQIRFEHDHEESHPVDVMFGCGEDE